MRLPLFCNDNYEVSDDGIVYNIKTGKALKPSSNPKGYQIIQLRQNEIQKVCLYILL